MAEIDDLDTTDANNTARWPEGMLGGDINDAARALEGILARWYADTNGSLSASGSSNAFTLSSNRTISALTDGIRMSFKANHSITGAATLNLNSLGAKDIKRFNGSALSSGDIISGQIVDVVYSSSLDDWIMVSALAALVGSTHADFGENGSPGNPAASTARVYAVSHDGLTTLAYRRSDGTVILLKPATQSNMETGTDVDRFVSPGRQHFHPGHPKAGGNLNGSGTPAFASGDYGMGAVTDNGTGNYTLALDTAFANTNYWCAAWGRIAGSGTASLIVSATSDHTKTSSAFQLTARNPGNEAANDSAEIGVTFWGDYA